MADLRPPTLALEAFAGNGHDVNVVFPDDYNMGIDADWTAWIGNSPIGAHLHDLDVTLFGQGLLIEIPDTVTGAEATTTRDLYIAQFGQVVVVGVVHFDTSPGTPTTTSVTLANGTLTVTVYFAAAGSQGSQGPQGLRGFQGFQGAIGNQGGTGSQGFQGAGSQGSQGSQGNQGFQGPGVGSQGSQGSQGAQGTTGASVMAVLYDTVLGATATSVDITGISGSYFDLRLVVVGRSDRAATTENVWVRVNNDSTAGHYLNWYVSGDGSSPVSGQASAQNAMYCGAITAASATANRPGSTELLLPNYAETTFYKNGMARAVNHNGTTMQVRTIGSLWSDASAINRLTVYTENTTNFVVGTRITLYGIGQ